MNILFTSVAISQLKCLDYAFFVAKMSKMTFTRFGGQVWLNGGQVRQFWGRGIYSYSPTFPPGKSPVMRGCGGRYSDTGCGAGGRVSESTWILESKAVQIVLNKFERQPIRRWTCPVGQWRSSSRGHPPGTGQRTGKS